MTIGDVVKHKETTKYNNWMDQVDKLLSKQFGVTSQHLEDYIWRNCFESGSSPAEAIDDFIYDNYPELADEMGMN